MGNITIQGDLTGDVPGGEVGGASNLTTAGAIPYVSAPGTLNQDPTALFWDAANDRLGIGTNAPAAPLHITTSAGGQFFRFTPPGALYGTLLFMSGNSSGQYDISTIGSSSFLAIGGGSDADTYIKAGNANSIGIKAATRNVQIGTSVATGFTDSNFKLDVATSGSAGTATLFNRTATTGSTLVAIGTDLAGTGSSNASATTTRLVVRAGGAQSTTALQEWQNSSGTNLSVIGPDGRFASSSGAVGVRPGGTNTLTVSQSSTSASAQMAAFYYTGGTKFLGLSSDVQLGFSNSTTDALLVDTALQRNAAGVVEVNNGTAGTYRDLILRRSQHNGVIVADLPAAAAGNAGSIQYVTDANATTIGSTVAGGGANKVMVWSDGAAWKIFAS